MPKESSGVIDAIKSFQDCPELRPLTSPDWRMFGKPHVVNDSTDLMFLMTMSGRSRGDAKTLINSNAIRRTNIDENHFVLTNKNGSQTFGFFRVT